MENQKKSILFALSTVLLWSTVATAFKIALQYVDFLQLLLFSTFVAVLAFLLISFFQKNTNEFFKISKKSLLQSALTGFLNPFLYYVILFKAYDLLPAQIAQPLNYLWPVMLVLLSVPLLGEKLKIKSVISLLIGFLGVYVISTRGDIFGFKIEQPLGVLLASGSSIIWALSWIFNKKNKSKEVVKLFWNFVFGFIYILITTLIFSEIKLPEINGILAVTYIGLFEMGITFYLWMKALQLTNSSDKISNFVFLSPFFALFFISIILKEHIYYTTIVGLILIIGGIFIRQIKFKKKL